MIYLSSFFATKCTYFSSLLVKNPHKILPKLDKSANLLFLRYVLKNLFSTCQLIKKQLQVMWLKIIQDISSYKYYTKEQIRNNHGKWWAELTTSETQKSKAKNGFVLSNLPWQTPITDWIQLLQNQISCQVKYNSVG